MKTYNIEMPAEFRSGNSIPVERATITRERMEEILIDAIEADRKQHDRMLAHEWIRSALGLSEDAPHRFDFYAQEIEKLKADRQRRGNSNECGPVAYGIKAANTGEIVTVLYGSYLDQVGEYLADLVVPLYTAPQSAAPVKVNAIFETQDGEVVGTTDAKVKRVEWQEDGSLTVVIDYWPQPAEMEDPNTSPLSGKGPFKTASELIDSINGPVNASPTIAYCQHPHCQTTGGCQGPCSKKQSEPVKVPSDAELLTCTGVSKHGDMPAIFGTADIRRFAECILKHFGQRPAEPDEWKLAVDHELTLMQSTADSYPSAKEAVKALINWHVAVATDPVFQQPAESHVERASRIVDSWPEWKRNYALTKHDVKPTQPAEPVDTDLVQKWQREHGVVLTPGTREAAMVVIRHDENGKPTVWCDPEIADLVRALNNGGVATVASCSGHGHRPGNIMLADGRELVVCKDADEARKVTSHFPGINGEAPQPAEPVAWESTTPAYRKYVTDSTYQRFSDKSKRWYKPYRCASCDGAQTAEPDYKQLFEQMCERCDALDAKLAEYSEREPVAYRLMRNNGNGVWLSDGRGWCEGRPEPSLVRGVEGNPQQWRIEYAYPAPQPAEPVKVPSDDDIEQLAKQFGFHRVPGTIELARAVLARYGQLAEPEGWRLVPVELTHIMMYAGAAARLTLDDPEEDVQGIWKAMLAAAPKFGEEE